MKGNDLEENRRDDELRDELDNCRKSTISQMIAQDRQTLKQKAEAFAQPRDTTAAQ